MKILFINAINPNSEIQSRFPPLGLAYLVSSLRKHFGQDAFEFKIVDQNVRNEMESFKPDIVGITSVSQNYGIAKAHAANAHLMGIPVIMGGIHISSLPSSMTDDMDVAVIGEGERTIVELLDLFIKVDKLRVRGLMEIKGIAFRDNNGALVLTEKREPITLLDEISLPARDMFKIDKRTYMFSSRGCPHRCVFCASTHFWGKMRTFSAEYVVSEIKELVEKYKVKFIIFCDDLMIADVARLENIVSLLSKEKFNGKVKFSINARASHIDEYVARLLGKMNIVSVGMGLESGNDRVLHYLKGDNCSVRDNQKAIFTLQRHGIAANASFVIGSPGESKEEIMDTYRFIKNSGLNFVDTYVLTPLPGTPIWKEAEERGLVNGKMNWGRLEVNYGKNDNPVILSEIIPKPEIDKLFSRFQRLRLWIAFKNVWKHPFLRYILIALVKQIGINIRVWYREFSFQQIIYAVLLFLTFALTSPFILAIFVIHYIQKWRGV